MSAPKTMEEALDVLKESFEKKFVFYDSALLLNVANICCVEVNGPYMLVYYHNCLFVSIDIEKKEVVAVRSWCTEHNHDC